MGKPTTGPTNMDISYSEGEIGITVFNQTGNPYKGYESWDDVYTLEFDDTWGINNDEGVGIGGKILKSNKGTHNINYNIKYLHKQSQLYITFWNEYWKQWGYFEFKDNNSVKESCQKLYNLIGEPKIQISTKNEKSKLDMDSGSNDKPKDEDSNVETINNEVSVKYPESSTRQLTKSELTKLSLEELQIMRNEIYGRHGYIFKEGGKMMKYFSEQSWYKPQFTNVDSKLTTIEKSNVELIVNEEKNKEH
ncbi:YARHG domain-containing protein [Maribacter sp. ACAM166]|uniref:YARHG domain-containing protein n=1 Tax=Maribacter sp. ACAM166 TaxID=2508996 RepID=UPI0010FCFBEB|nr:YARHG domain-containing protein [Maribacter sp. ACAM166]TLP72897.1 YARHG domain-containing protein [Maribacter sp. ACAM166]